MSNIDINITDVVREVESKYKVDLRKRIFKFAVNVLKYLMQITDTTEIRVIKYQLAKSATSIGANYEEAQSSSRNEFIHKVRISLRESNESKYWLRILTELKVGKPETLQSLLNEVTEISLILGSIASKMDKRS